MENKQFEQILDEKNLEVIKVYNSLLNHIEKDHATDNKSNYQPMFIIGAPSSGTTLMHQVLINNFDVGYINNFIARFWDAPVIGAKISKDFLKLKPKPEYKSRFGSTKSLSGPHEFGFFWKRFFPVSQTHYSNKIDEKLSVCLKNEIFSLLNLFGKDTVFKNLTCGLKIKILSELFPQAKYILVKRNYIDIGISLIRGRKELYGDVNYFWSLRPKEYNVLKDMDPYSQVLGQIHYIYAQIEEDRKQIKENNWIEVDYKDLCQRFGETMKKIGQKFEIQINENFTNESFITKNNRKEYPEIAEKLYVQAKKLGWGIR